MSSRRRRARCSAFGGLTALALLITTAPAFGASPAHAGIKSTERSALELTSQTSWVTKTSGFSVTFKVTSPLPASRLGVQIDVCSPLPNRTAFEIALVNGCLANHPLPSEFCIDRTPVVPLTNVVASDDTVSMQLPVSATTPPASCGPTSGLELACAPGTCDGVYPLDVALIDTVRNAVVASLTTQLVYVAEVRQPVPLTVGLVVPVGTSLALLPNGSPASPSVSALDRLEQTLRSPSAKQLRLSLNLYPQLFSVLEDESKDGATVLGSLRSLLTHSGRHLELLGAPFAALDASALGDAGLSSDVAGQLSRGVALFSSTVHRTPRSSPYVSSYGLDQNGLRALEAACVNEIVVPESAVVLLPRGGLTPTAPFELTPPGSCTKKGGPKTAVVPDAFVSDEELSSRAANSQAHPVLAAHQVLAELAQTYFELPDASNRGVVVAPSSLSLNTPFLSTLLAGLASSRVLTTATLTNLFSSIPVGVNGNEGAAQVPIAAIGANTVVKSEVIAARSDIAVIQSVIGAHSALISQLRDTVWLSETAGLSATAQASYTRAVRAALRSIGESLSLTGSHAVTLTERSGNIPITIRTTWPTPVDVVVKLRSSELVIPRTAQPFIPGCTSTSHANGASAQKRVVLTAKDTSGCVRVSTRTSGDAALDVELLSPLGGVTLAATTFTVRSTAVSGVAVGISIAALLVLLAWWSRSLWRRRRQRKNVDLSPLPLPDST